MKLDFGSRIYKYFYKYYGHSEAGFYKWYQIFAQTRRIISWVLSAFYYSKKILEKENSDIIHFNSSVLTDWCIASRNLKAKKIIHIREPLARGYFGIRRDLLRYIYSKYCDHIIAISPDNMRRVNLPNKTSVVYNPINFNDFDYSKYSQQSNEKVKKILFLGGIHKAKGFDVLVDALKYLNSNIQIILCGYYSDSNSSQQLFSKMHKKLKNCKSSKNVQILGVVNDIQNVIASVDVVIFPHYSSFRQTNN
ncbi:MAG: glycosyltransferase family 4 protein [Ignavibacteriales bacterium]|nr:glycosyltransferase family 4 protein [Ignavibacteriales bacterium]